MQKILITGGAGYLGSILVPALLHAGYRVTVIDNLLYEETSLISCSTNANFSFIKDDIRKHNLLRKYVLDNDIIIPLAAYVGAPLCQQKPQLANQVNYEAIKNIIKLLSTDQLIIYPSSTSVYGEHTGEKYYDENSIINPISVYAKTKAKSEEMLLDFVNTIVLRITSIFGISPRMRTDLTANKLANMAVQKNMVTFQENSLINSYIHLKDVARSFIFSIDNYPTMIGKVYNVCSSHIPTSQHQLCQVLKNLLPDLLVQEERTSGLQYTNDYRISSKKIETLGWSPTISLEQGFLELIQGFNIIKETT
ncbi:MAG: NAD(P)-dependent oxidoreductase [Legionellales bacterium]|nr:NAD(P)-dependent oxidoreductase [Legionellales bacterium]